MIRLSASGFYDLFRPTKCPGRVYLRYKGEPEAPPGPYDEVTRKLGQRHEEAHLQKFAKFVDISTGAVENREIRTREEIGKKSPVLYHSLLRTKYRLGSKEVEIIGEPDFTIFDENGYVIRDSKISRNITEKEHPEILRQLEIYGWLYYQMFRIPPVRLEVHSGKNEIVPITYDNGAMALSVLHELLKIKELAAEAYNPVGWTKCGGCPFNYRCWTAAEKELDVALLPGVDQGLAIALHQEGTKNVHDLLAVFDERSLAEFKRPWGDKTQRVGKKAESIIRIAHCFANGKEILLQPPDIPGFPNYVMFDLEGMPPYLDELDKIYLWGLQVYGEEKGRYTPAVAGFGEKGDEEGWNGFLKNAEGILKQYPDIRFIHWHHYERVRIDMYVERYGDPKGVAAHVRKNLLDLLPICQDSIALPLPSYSLKVVEKYAGFQRTQDEYGGDWAMAKYIEATELEDAEARDEVMDEILKYNEEDLAATWHVLQWLKSKRK
jgi:predicted RecB family nuclease